jgi:hypothetical protein
MGVKGQSPDLKGLLGWGQEEMQPGGSGVAGPGCGLDVSWPL